MFDNQSKTLRQIKEAENIRIHEGTFHLDDILCVSLTKKVNPNIKVIRDRENIPEDTKDVICDCYGGYFDHHFDDLSDIRKRQNGSSMASIGCLMQVLGPEVFKDKWKQIDEELISKFDNADLGLKDDFISSNLGKLNVCYKSNRKEDEQLAIAYDYCDKIINSLTNYKKNRHNSFLLLNEYLKIHKLKDISDYLGKCSNNILNEINNIDSSLNIILSGMTKEEAKEFLFDILDTEREAFILKQKISKELERIKNKSIEENLEYAIFDTYPGTITTFIETPIKFVIFKQLGCDKYCINTIAQNIKTTNGFPPPKIPIPKELSGKQRILKKEIEEIYPKMLDIISYNKYEDFNDISNRFSNLLNKTINISNTQELNDFKNFIIDELDRKKTLYAFFIKEGIDFVHPGSFFAQTKDKESAINFVEKILSNNIFLK